MVKRKEMFRQKQRMFSEKLYRFSIRKFSVGVGSTVIAAYLLFASSSLAFAQDLASGDNATVPTEQIASIQDGAPPTANEESIVSTNSTEVSTTLETDLTIVEVSSNSISTDQTEDETISLNESPVVETEESKEAIVPSEIETEPSSEEISNLETHQSSSTTGVETSEKTSDSSETNTETVSSEVAENSATEGSVVSVSEKVTPVETILTVEDGEEVAHQIHQIATDEEPIGDIRTAGIVYQVRYIDEETNERVSRTAQTEVVETNRLNATTYVKVIADLPEGYELADGQSPVLVQQIFEKQTNILSFVVTKKKEDETMVSEPTTSGSSGFRINPSATPEVRDGYTVTELVPPVQDPNGYHVQAVAGEYTNNVLTSYLLYSTRMEDTATDAAGNDIPTKLYLTKVAANNTNSIRASIVVDLTQPAGTIVAFDGGTITLDTPIRVRGSNLPTATYSLATGSNKRLDSIFLQGAVNTDNSLVNAFGVTVSPYTYQLTKYRDKTTGAELAPIYVQEGWRYDTYTTAPIDIPGYTLVGDSGNTDSYINHGRNYVAGDVLYQKSNLPINIYDTDSKDRKIIGTQDTQLYRKLVYTETSTIYTEYYQVIGDAASTPSPEEFFAQLEAGTLNIITDKLFAATQADGVTLSGGHTLNSPVNKTKKIGDYFTTDKTGVYPLRNPSSLLAQYPNDYSDFTPAEVLALPTVSDSPIEVTATNPGRVAVPFTAQYVPNTDTTAPTKTSSVRMSFTIGLTQTTSTGSDVSYYYTANPQVAAVKFVDTTDSTVKHTENLNGKTAETFGWDPATKIAEFEAMGYTVVNRDAYAPTGTYDTIDGNVQEFTYELTPKTTQVTDNPLVFTRTTNYIKEEDSSQVAAPYTTTVTYERTGTRNEVTGSVTWNSWTAKDGDTILEGQALPTLAGYSVKSVTSNYGTVTAVSVVENIDTADLISTGNYDLVETVVYAKAAQTGSVKFVDTSDNSVKFTETLNGQTGDAFGYDPATKITEFENLGYTVFNRDNYSSTGSFDTIDGNSQDFVYELTPKVSPITPDNPGKPGQPIDPNNPDGPTWPTDKGVDDVSRTISRTVSYVKAEGGEAAPGSSNTVTFERSGEINHVTGQVTWQAWTAKDGDATLEGHPLPLVTGYLAQSATNNGTPVAPSTTADAVEATETTGNITEVVTYVKLGSWIPQPPTGTVEVPPTVYPNNPDDPTQPGTDVPTIPYIPGYIPVGPDGSTPLVPKVPGDPTQGYEAPPVPSDPSTDTPVPYIKASQVASVTFVDTTDNSTKHRQTLTGQTGDAFGYDPAAKITEFENLGYTVVNRDNYSSTGSFDTIDGNSQDFVYELTPKVSPITPDNPGKPGQPIDPNNPDGPTWPTDKGVDDVSRTISRTVSYVKAEGGEAAPGSSNTVTFERSGEINHVTGQVTWQAWTAKDGDATLDGHPLPLVTGYLAQSATNNGTPVAPSTTADAVEATETTGNITEVVTYVKLGSWIPQPPTGTVEVPPTVYPNNPDDPTQPGTDVPTIPYIPGYIPVGPDGSTPLVPKVPGDPTQGYEVPPVPSDPSTDTPVPYIKASQVASVTFVDTTDNSTKHRQTLTGQTGDAFGYDPAAKITEFENLGYTVVNRDNYSSTGSFDTIDGNSQDFVYELTPKVSPITPDNPGKPGQPIDPNNPDGPTWPTDKGVDDVSRTISRTVSYVKAEGGEAAPGSSNTVTFERSGEINHVTGQVTWQAWTAKDGDATLDGHPLPAVSGYLAQSATNNGTPVASSTTADAVEATETTGNITEVVTYVKLGSWIPQPPTGTVEVPPTVYPNNPDDPTQPGTDVPTIPYIPGYIPVGPDGTTPLTPVDPGDPTQGYEAPPVPSDPSTDTPVPYIKASQVASVTFVDTTDNSTKHRQTLTGQTGDAFGYDPAAKITEFENLGYTVVNRDNYSSTGSFDTIDGNSQDFVYELTPKVSPITPDNPGKPGQPIDPNNPDGPTWPTDKGVDDVSRTISRTVSYVKAEGGEAAPGSSNTVTFERSGEINHVTGQVTWQAWTAKDGDATLDGHPLPLVTGYLVQGATNNGTPVAPSTTADAVEATETTGNITEVVTYVKLGSWIPQPPTGTVEVPPTVYPNNPDDPTQPGTDVPTIPYIPGYIPVGPDGSTPLVPKVPGDPTQGYEAPPVPSDPSTDTPINYVPVIPDTPAVPEEPAKPAVPVVPNQPRSATRVQQLPNTGEESSAAGMIAATMLLGSFALTAKRRRKEE